MTVGENDIYNIEKFGVNVNDEDCIKKLEQNIYNCIKNHKKNRKDIVVVCIGSDRSTGDSLGPLSGTLISKRKNIVKKVKIYGTLNNPVHAQNIDRVFFKNIDEENSLIIVIDASLSEFKNIGDINVISKHIYPGAGVNKELNPVGDISITGVVNIGGFMEYETLQNTRLSLVYKMSKVIDSALNNALKRILHEQKMGFEVVDIFHVKQKNNEKWRNKNDKRNCLFDFRKQSCGKYRI